MINLLKVKVRKVGGSFGLFIQKKDAKELGLKEDEEVTIDVNRTNPLKEMFGTGKLPRPTKTILKELRKNESKYW